MMGNCARCQAVDEIEGTSNYYLLQILGIIIAGIISFSAFGFILIPFIVTVESFLHQLGYILLFGVASMSFLGYSIGKVEVAVHKLEVARVKRILKERGLDG